ncbi:MAG TPA: hypothetical protein PKZ35_12185 [Gammaproteobacteria bacterium]|nr:hypothetical protein [Chromatiaceae bacterium]HPE80755.1 hypothetical protein [Gammaproteobacteria bacterium]
MLNKDSIESFLAQRRATYVAKIKIRQNDDVVLLTVPVENIGRTSGAGKTSKRQLTYLTKAISEEFGAEAVIIYDQGDQFSQIETALCAALKKQYGEHIASVVLSLESMDRAVAWIECQSDDSPTGEIEKLVSEFMSLMGVEKVDVHFLYEADQTPSLVVVLRTVKTAQPCKIQDIRSALIEKGYPLLREEWIQGKLDLLRKKEVIVRQNDGSYCLSQLGLMVTPHGTYRSSSDVERALALGRAKW